MKKEFIKVAAITGACLALFGGAFLGVNHLAFAAVTEGTEYIQLIEAPVNTMLVHEITPAGTPEESDYVPQCEYIPQSSYTQQEAFQKPTLTISVYDIGHTLSENVLSPEDAALAGALYVWDMFGECMDGKYVFMWFGSWPSYTKTYWGGTFADSKKEYYNNPHLYSFFIDAVTGQRIDILGPPPAPTVMSQEDNAVLLEARINGVLTELSRNVPVPGNIDEYLQVATNFASRHFNETDVVLVEFGSIAASDFALDEDRNIIVTAQVMSFIAVDCTGRDAIITIGAGTKELHRIFSRHNDLVVGR